MIMNGFFWQFLLGALTDIADLFIGKIFWTLTGITGIIRHAQQGDFGI
jgi:hypothetical protein